MDKRVEDIPDNAKMDAVMPNSSKEVQGEGTSEEKIRQTNLTKLVSPWKKV